MCIKGPIEMFLTWKPIIPLSRLTYSAFLVNGVVVLHHLGTLRAPTYVEDISLFFHRSNTLIRTINIISSHRDMEHGT
uniref:Uncharacterized protein n=1 Tax=Timema poppense TaxID=170557 RepID=A0A7R9HH46_TIMPO|nr:unnamed protein product [Timema poppensis]